MYQPGVRVCMARELPIDVDVRTLRRGEAQLIVIPTQHPPKGSIPCARRLASRSLRLAVGAVPAHMGARLSRISHG